VLRLALPVTLLAGALLHLVPGSPGPAAAEPAAARAAAEAFVARLGGVRVGDLLVEQTVTLYHPGARLKTATGTQRVLVKSPGRLRVERDADGEREVLLVVNDRVWTRRPDGRTYEAPPRNGVPAPAHLPGFQRSAAELLAEWQALGVDVTVSHPVTLAGRPLTVIGARPGERDRPAVWLDPEYGVVRLVTRGQRPPGMLDRMLSEHRAIAGALFLPHREELFVDGQLRMLVTVRSVTVDRALPDALFDPAALARER
jgi:outer membrane lipoprotein-sorting protein